MATTTILHVGDDLCQRIPGMQTVGFVMFQSECSVPAIRTAFDREEDYSAVIFHCDVAPVPGEAVYSTRELSESPLVLFQNPTVACEETDFDLLIPPLTPPSIWLQKLRELIETSRELCEESMRLRNDCAATRSRSQMLRARSARNRVSPIDPNALWRGESEVLPESKPPEESRPPDVREKAG